MLCINASFDSAAPCCALKALRGCFDGAAPRCAWKALRRRFDEASFDGAAPLYALKVLQRRFEDASIRIRCCSSGGRCHASSAVSEEACLASSPLTALLLAVH
jgi:hypothetical protein